MGYNKRVTEAAFLLLTQHSTCLTHLTLAGLKIVTDDLLRPILSRNPGLQSLELSECHHLTR